METYEELKKKNLGGQFPDDKTGLAPDYINAWMGLGSIKSGLAKADNESCWREVPHYEEYLRGKNYSYTERIIADSDPQKVIVANKLADKFNSAREKLKAAKDSEAASKFFDEANNLIQGY